MTVDFLGIFTYIFTHVTQDPKFLYKSKLQIRVDGQHGVFCLLRETAEEGTTEIYQERSRPRWKFFSNLVC